MGCHPVAVVLLHIYTQTIHRTTQNKQYTERHKTNNTQSNGKAVPLQAWSGPEGSRNLKFSDFMTTAQDGGKVVSLTYRPPLPPRNNLVLSSVRG